MKARHLLFYFPPAILGAIAGWIFSSQVQGHHVSQSGWFDFRSLDPVFFIIQDLFYIGQGVFLAIVATIAIDALAGSLAGKERGRIVACALTSLFIVGWTGNTLLQVKRDEEAHQEEVARDLQAQSAAHRQAAKAAEASFAKLGWVRYPRVQKTEAIPEGFRIEGGSARFTAADDATTVANYYLSRCESWEETTGAYRINVRNQNEPFLVTVGKKEGQVGVIQCSAATAITPLPQKGPTTISSRPVAQNTPEEPTPSIPAFDRLVYPGSTKEESGGAVRLWTPDGIERVLAFYQSLGSQPATTEEETETYHLVVPVNDNPVPITLRHVFQSDGTQGTLIEYQISN